MSSYAHPAGATHRRTTSLRDATGLDTLAASVELRDLRDRWSPLGLRDRGYLLIFGPVTAFAYTWLAWQDLTFAGLMSGTYFPGLKITAP